MWLVGYYPYKRKESLKGVLESLNGFSGHERAQESLSTLEEHKRENKRGFNRGGQRSHALC